MFSVMEFGLQRELRDRQPCTGCVAGREEPAAGTATGTARAVSTATAAQLCPPSLSGLPTCLGSLQTVAAFMY